MATWIPRLPLRRAAKAGIRLTSPPLASLPLKVAIGRRLIVKRRKVSTMAVKWVKQEFYEGGRLLKGVRRQCWLGS